MTKVHHLFWECCFVSSFNTYYLFSNLVLYITTISFAVHGGEDGRLVVCGSWLLRLYVPELEGLLSL